MGQDTLMKLRHLFFLLFVLISLISFVGAADVFEVKIPPGWLFHDAALFESGLKAVVTWEDVPEEVARYGNYASRLLVFDKNDRLVNDLTFAKPKFLRLTRDDKIILMEAPEEEVQKITVFDSQGRELFEVLTKGRWPWPALLGREIGLARQEIGENEITGRVSIIDGETGQEKITFGPPSGGKRIRGFSGFLPIGEGGKYLVAFGATVFLKTYLHPGTDIWKINNIGGNVRSISSIDENHVSVKYDINDFESHKFLAGVAVVEWRSGNIVFRQDSNDRKTELGRLFHQNPVITIKEGDLFFTFGSKFGIRVAKSPRSSEKWDKTKVRKYKIDNWSEHDQQTADSKHIIKKLGKDNVRIEKIRHKEENWKD
jgi:hypothetical protein